MLEDRTLPTVFNLTINPAMDPSGAVKELITDLNSANSAGGTNTLNLYAGGVYDLTAVNNSTNGANGLPVISGGGKKTVADNLTIIGNGDIIQRDTSAPAFRLFDVAQGASLTLENVTLQGGKASGSGAAADGGAIYNQGMLTFLGATVQGNTAQGSDGAPGGVSKNKKLIIPAQAGADAAGGGIWSSGVVNLQGGSIVQDNQAIGGQGGFTFLPQNGGAGGGGFGGGLYEAGGSVSVTNATLAGNAALGGRGGFGESFTGSISGNGGAAAGGGLYVAGGTLSMSNDTVKTNLALGGNGGGGDFSPGAAGSGGAGSGGGIYVGGGTVTLQDVELLSNRAQGGDGGEFHFTGGVTSDAIREARGLGGNGLGGGLYVSGGTVTLTDDTVTGNTATAGLSGAYGIPTGSPGFAGGGGIYIVSQANATVNLSSFTVANTNTNFDYLVEFEYYGVYFTLVHQLIGEDDIDGSYNLI
jgi:hypothetical protein